MCKKRYNYRISKYNPVFRDTNGFFQKDEWTSIYDVGKIYENARFTIDDYIVVEKKYIHAIDKLIEITKTESLKIRKLEDNNNKCPYKNNSRLFLKSDITSVIQSCLREEYWCILSGPQFTLHFGYDYYFYVLNCSYSYSEIEKCMSELGLFVENDRKPIH